MSALVYIVLGHYGDIEGQFSVCGVYEKEEDARDACVDSRYGYGPIPLNSNEPGGLDAIKPWPGFRYPHGEEE